MHYYVRTLEVVWATVLFVLLIFIFVTMDQIHLVYKRSEICKPSVLTMTEPKSLEEMLWGYTTLWSIRKYNLTKRRIHVPPTVRDSLVRMFVSPLLPSLSELPPACAYEAAMTVQIPPELYRNASAGGTHVSIDFSGRLTKYPEPVVRSASLMGQGFAFDRALTAFSERVMAKSGTYSSAEGPEGTTVCVWVSKPKWIPDTRHYRRSRRNYFSAAMNLFRSRYEAMFVVIGELDRARDWFEGANVFLVHTKSAAQSLALVAACNHTIIEPSPLSLWAAFRNRGVKVVYDIPKEMDDLLYAEPDWFVLTVRPETKIRQEFDTDLLSLRDD